MQFKEQFIRKLLVNWMLCWNSLYRNGVYFLRAFNMKFCINQKKIVHKCTAFMLLISEAIEIVVNAAEHTQCPLPTALLCCVRFEKLP